MKVRRWKVACINWSTPGAPHAMAYIWDGSEIRFDRFFATWAEAMAYVDAHRRSWWV